MKPVPEEWKSLRLVAKASDRANVADKLRPAFEKRLEELGYGPLAIAHAFSTLTGSGTVAEALAELAQNARFERRDAVVLDFEAAEREPSLPAGHSLTITGVERDDHGIHVRYTIHPPLPLPADRPRAQARDDCGQEYANLGSFVGLANPVDHTTGGLILPLPPPRASQLRVRVSWANDPKSLWERPAYELRITL